MIDREALPVPEARRSSPRQDLRGAVEERDGEVGAVVGRGQGDAVERAAVDVVVDGLLSRRASSTARRGSLLRVTSRDAPIHPPRLRSATHLTPAFESVRASGERTCSGGSGSRTQQANDRVMEVVRSRCSGTARDGSGGRAHEDGKWGLPPAREQLGQRAQHADLVGAARSTARQCEGHSHDGEWRWCKRRTPGA